MRKEVYQNQLIYHISEKEMLENQKVIKAIKKYGEEGVKFSIRQNEEGGPIKEAYTLIINVPPRETWVDKIFGRNKNKNNTTYNKGNSEFPKFNNYQKRNTKSNNDRRYGDYRG